MNFEQWLETQAPTYASPEQVLIAFETCGQRLYREKMKREKQKIMKIDEARFIIAFRNLAYKEGILE